MASKANKKNQDSEQHFEVCRSEFIRHLGTARTNAANWLEAAKVLGKEQDVKDLIAKMDEALKNALTAKAPTREESST